MADPSAAEVDSPRGWLIVVLGFASLVLVWGTLFTFTVYAGHLAAAFGLSALRVNSVFSLATAAFFVAGGGLGVAIARLPLRPVVAAAGVGLGVAVAGLQVAAGYLGVAAAFVLFGMAGGTLFVVLISLVPMWFDAYQGRAMGVTLTGNGLGVLVLPPAWVWLLARTDLRGGFVVVGGAATVAVLLVSLVARRPAGLRAGDGLAVDLDWVRSRLGDRRFLVAWIGFPLLWSWYFVLSASLVDVLTSSGIDRTVAATAFGTIGGISILTRLGAGAIADRVGHRRTLASGVVLAVAGLLLLPATDTVALMYLTLVVFGIGLGAVAPLYSPILIDRFGPENATAVVGLFTAVEATTAFGAPIAMSLLVVATGGYAVPLAALAAVTLGGVALFAWGTRSVAVEAENQT